MRAEKWKKDSYIGLVGLKISRKTKGSEYTKQLEIKTVASTSNSEQNSCVNIFFEKEKVRQSGDDYEKN